MYMIQMAATKKPTKQVWVGNFTNSLCVRVNVPEVFFIGGTTVVFKQSLTILINRRLFNLNFEVRVGLKSVKVINDA